MDEEKILIIVKGEYKTIVESQYIKFIKDT